MDQAPPLSFPDSHQFPKQKWLLLAFIGAVIFGTGVGSGILISKHIYGPVPTPSSVIYVSPTPSSSEECVTPPPECVTADGSIKPGCSPPYIGEYCEPIDNRSVCLCPDGTTCPRDASGDYEVGLCPENPPPTASCVQTLKNPGRFDFSVCKSQCLQSGGNWLDQYQECEGISETTCRDLEGLYSNCASPCRHQDPAPAGCTDSCIWVCSIPTSFITL